jgi:hypothetical protein
MAVNCTLAPLLPAFPEPGSLVPSVLELDSLQPAITTAETINNDSTTANFLRIAVITPQMYWLCTILADSTLTLIFVRGGVNDQFLMSSHFLKTLYNGIGKRLQTRLSDEFQKLHIFKKCILLTTDIASRITVATFTKKTATTLFTTGSFHSFV